MGQMGAFGGGSFISYLFDENFCYFFVIIESSKVQGSEAIFLFGVNQLPSSC